MHASPTRPTRPDVDAGRLWAGGAATAVVAGLVGVVGVLVAEGLLDLDMADLPLLPIGSSFAVRYALSSPARPSMTIRMPRSRFRHMERHNRAARSHNLRW